MQRSFLLSSLLIAGLGSILFSAKAIVVKLCYQYGVDPATVLSLRMLFSLPFFGRLYGGHHVIINHHPWPNATS
jgi:hypothetical protein